MRDLELVVSSGDNSYLVSARSAAGDTPETPTTFPFDERGLARRLLEVELALAKSAAVARRMPGKDEHPIQELGTELFAFLFPARVREHFSAERTQAARDDTSVQIRLRIRPPELAALPWELLYDPARDDYLCLSTPVVRYLEVFEPTTPLAVAGPVRVLGMVARPGALSDLDVEREKRWLHDALAGLVGLGQVELTWTSGQTWSDLLDSLDHIKPNVFHFIGHGGFDAERGEGIVALADEDDGVYRMPASNLALLFGDYRSLRLVVLNACEGARARAGDVFSSTAAALTRRGIPAVVAMQYDISDQAAIAFARGLYGAIATGLGVDRAVTRARRAIKFSRADTLEWATPVLYLRSPDARLFEVTRPSQSVQPAAVTPPAVTAATPARQEPGRLAISESGEPSQAARGKPGDQPPVPAGSLLIQIHVGSLVHAVAFSPDGTHAATGSNDWTVRVWNTITGREVTRAQHGQAVYAVAFSPDGTRLASASADGTVSIWDTVRGGEVARIEQDNAIYAVAFSPDGTRLATAGHDKTARTWDAATGRELTRMTHEDAVHEVAYSPDGTRLAIAGHAKTARIWDTATGRELTRMTHDRGVQTVAFSPDGTRLATGSADKTARIWDAATGRELTRITHEDVVEAVVFSPDGTRLATGSADKTARVWDISGQEIIRLPHDAIVTEVAFSPDGTRLATASHGKTIRIWAV